MLNLRLNGQTSVIDRCPKDRTCLTAPEMDYFLRRDARCYKLENDSVEMAGKIQKYQINEALFKANEQDLKAQASTNKLLANNYKASAIDFQDKYTVAQGKANKRGKLLIGSVILNIGFIALGVVLLKP